jgi:hypothetical protein
MSDPTAKEAAVHQDDSEQQREGETSKPPDETQEIEGPADGPGKSGAGESDLGDTSQGEPGR